MATALITGGTSGIGAAFARALAARGDDLVLVARDEARLAQIAGELADRYGAQVETVAADLADRSDLDRVAVRVADPDRPVDLLISNAGFGVKASLTGDTDEHQHAIDVMIRAVLQLGAAAGRAMSQRGYGAIINVSSTAGFVAMGGYSAIKAWVTAYTEGLAVELGRRGVHVTALCPGFVRTEFHSRADISTSKLPDWLWLDADDLVREALEDSARGAVISIPSRRYRIMMFLARHAPRAAVRSVSARLSSSRH